MHMRHDGTRAINAPRTCTCGMLVLDLYTPLLVYTLLLVAGWYCRTCRSLGLHSCACTYSPEEKPPAKATRCICIHKSTMSSYTGSAAGASTRWRGYRGRGLEECSTVLPQTHGRRGNVSEKKKHSISLEDLTKRPNK